MKNEENKMTKNTAARIAMFSSSADVQKWSSGIAKFAATVRPYIGAPEALACGECPFRVNIMMGGCIGEECPVHAVRKALQLATKRMAAGTKEIYKAMYAGKRN